MERMLRIANGQGFWGDSSDAPARLVAQQPDLDFLTLDYLAEVSMSILATKRERDPQAGYAPDFVDVIASLAPYWRAGGRARVVTNAGGLNPQACARACAVALRKAGGPPLKIGVVTGDDVLPTIKAAAARQALGPYRNLETGEPIEGVLDRLVTANAYLGGRGIAEALDAGCHIVITGRVADPSLTVGPCVAHFGWSWDEWNRLAGATVAGHLIECGTQVTGGISTDWLDLSDPAHIGFPIAEVGPDGGCVITKPASTGGRVSEATVKEQLLYEIGDPGHYLSPEVTVSFLSLQVAADGPDRVSVRGALGGPPPPNYKVSATYRAGFRAQGMLTVFGRNAVAKARRCGEIVLLRLRDAGHAPAQWNVECLGAGAVAPGTAPGTGARQEDSILETVLRLSAADERAEVLEHFARELMPLITAGPQGITGYAEGRPRVHPVFGYWPCLIDRGLVEPRVEAFEP
jgi:hypothetical protein